MRRNSFIGIAMVLLRAGCGLRQPDRKSAPHGDTDAAPESIVGRIDRRVVERQVRVVSRPGGRHFVCHL